MIKNDNKINLFVMGSARSLNVTKIQEFNDEQAVLIRIYFSFFRVVRSQVHGNSQVSGILENVVLTGFQKRRKDSQISRAANLETRTLNLELLWRVM